ncbi:MAG TPA: aldose epimerase family protein [Bacilli bacterium]|nr:aldose epimerase family protein [Bacilli bacterium]
MKKFVLENSFQKITFLNVGATIYSWEIKEKNNRNIVLSNKNLDDYLNSASGFLGATIGRVTNRIKDGQFVLDGVHYQLAKNFDDEVNAGHGGPHGFWAQTFTGKKLSKHALEFTYHSKDKEEGYPGNFDLKVRYTLDKQGLHINYKGQSDQKTIANITNHSYFNLEGSKSIHDHSLLMDGPYFLPYDDKKAITGVKAKTAGTPLDFTKLTKLGKIINDPYLTDPKTCGIDHCLYFGAQKKLVLQSADLRLTIKTSYPAVQLYSTGFPGPQELLNGHVVKDQALAIEPQLPVDAINFPNLGNIILEKDEEYSHFIRYELEII